MAIVMNMSSYVVEDPSPTNPECADKAMLAGRNPTLQLATQQHLSTLMRKYPTLPASLVTADAEAFLQEMYSYQR